MRLFPQYKNISGPFFCALVVAVILSAMYGKILYRDACSYFLQISMTSSVDGTAKLYLDTGRGLSEQEVVLNLVESGNQFRMYDFSLPHERIRYLRFDPFDGSGAIAIKSIAVINGFGNSLLPIDLHSLRPANQIRVISIKGDVLSIVVEELADDPQIAVPLSNPLPLDSFYYFPWLFFLGYWLGGFLIAFTAMLLLIVTLRKMGFLVGFFDHPINISVSWIRQNKLFAAVIVCLLAFRGFFILTYPLDTCSDAGTYYHLMQSGMSTLLHATGYPYLMHFFSAFLPTKMDLLIFQHVIDGATQLVLMILLKKRFGLLAAITAGVFYGLELRAINWASRSTPEWLQGVFFALAFVGAMEAYFAERPLRKIVLYSLSAWLFTWSVLVKFLTAVMLPLYLILFILEGKKKWKARWLCLTTMCLISVSQFAFFIYFYHFPSTGTKALTHDVGWILNEKIRSFLPKGHHFSESGPWSKRYGILISEMSGKSVDIDGYGVYQNVNSVSRSIRKPYQDRYLELLAKSDFELQNIIKTNHYVKDLDQNFIVSNHYLGLSETDDLLKKVFLETVRTYPKEYLYNVIRGIKESFFIETSYYIAIIHNPFSSNQNHPFQLTMTDIVQNFPWGYALFNVSPTIRCMYEEPIFLKAGLQFFTSWGESINTPTIIKWSLIGLAIVLACIDYRNDKTLELARLYLFMGVLAIVLLIILSNILFIFRDKEFQVCQHLLCLLMGISVSSIASYGKFGWFERKQYN
jgi:hypothetical protein